MIKKIALFNHKGGVSKTMTTISRMDKNSIKGFFGFLFLVVAVLFTAVQTYFFTSKRIRI